MIRFILLFVVVVSGVIVGLTIYDAADGLDREAVAEEACNAQLNGSDWEVVNATGDITCQSENGTVRELQVNVSMVN